MRLNWLKTASALGIAGSLLVPPVDGSQRRTLGRVTELAVVVQEIPDGLAPLNLPASQLKTDTELAMRVAGITVSDDADSYLLLRVEGLRVPGSSGRHLGFVYFLQLEFRQRVALFSDLAAFAPNRYTSCFCVDEVRPDYSVSLTWEELDSETGQLSDTGDPFPEGLLEWATTWDAGMIATVGKEYDAARREVRQDSEDLVAQFLNDLLAARDERSSIESMLEDMEREDAGDDLPKH